MPKLTTPSFCDKLTSAIRPLLFAAVMANTDYLGAAPSFICRRDVVIFGRLSVLPQTKLDRSIMKFMISDHFDTWQSAPLSRSRHADMDSAAEQAFSISHSDTAAAAPTWHCFELQYSHEYYDGVLSSGGAANVVIVSL